MGPRGVHREGAWVVVLSLLTCGIYYFYWRYVAAWELREYLQDPSIHPTLDLLLSLCCLPYSLYVDYSYARRIEDIRPRVGLLPKEIAKSTIMFGILGWCTGMGVFVTAFIIQGELNALWEHAQEI